MTSRSVWRQEIFSEAEEVLPWWPGRARPTTGSDRGSLRDHDLTLLVRPHFGALAAARQYVQKECIPQNLRINLAAAR
jgi:hypothetical protein